MKPVVHESFGHVLDIDVGAVFPVTQVEDAFMSDQAVRAAVEDGETRFQALGNVVGVEDCQLTGLFQSLGAHHPNIHPGNGRDTGTAMRGASDRAAAVG